MTERLPMGDYMPELARLENLKTDDVVESLEILIDIGITITAYADQNTADGLAAQTLFFHHDLRSLFSKWRSTSRHVLKTRQDFLKDEYEILEESDSVSSRTVYPEEPDFYTEPTRELLRSIQLETSKRLMTLRAARAKALTEKDTLKNTEEISEDERGVFYLSRTKGLYRVVNGKEQTYSLTPSDKRFDILDSLEKYFKQTKEIANEIGVTPVQLRVQIAGIRKKISDNFHAVKGKDLIVGKRRAGYRIGEKYSLKKKK